MPTTPYAKLIVTVNGGPPQTGGITAADGDTILLRGESTVGWKQQSFELYDFPVGMALPAGWSDPGDGTYFYATDPFPPAFTASPWAKFMLRLKVNGGLNGAGATDPTLTDEATAITVPSPNGMGDLGFLEGSQFSAHREWTGDQKANLRIIDAAVSLLVAGPVLSVSGTAPIVSTGGATPVISITPATSLAPGSMSAADKTKLDGLLTATAPTTITPNASADPGASTTRAARADHTHGIATATPGAIAIGDSASEGGATSFARSDHRHSLAAPAAPQTIGGANSAGVATAPARADHVHQGVASVSGTAPIVSSGGATPAISITAATTLAAGSMSASDKTFITNLMTASTPTTIVPDATADPGVSTTFAARADHTHGIVADVAGAIAIGDSASEGVSTSFARADHRHSLAAPAAPTVIQPDASASPGVATAPARADHVHGIVADPPGAIAIGDTAAEGSATSFARSDHRHSLAAPATPQSVGAANSAGVATAPARADHVHAWSGQRELGANTITGTTTTRYLSIGYNEGTASVNPLDMPVVKAFKIDSLAMKARVGGTAGQTISATVRKNGTAVGTAVLTTASDATTGSSSFTAVSFSPGDTWGLQIDKNGSIATSPADIFWSVGITSP